MLAAVRKMPETNRNLKIITQRLNLRDLKTKLKKASITFRLDNKTANIFCGLSASKNKAGYTATPVACGWAGAVFEVTQSFGQEQ